MDTNEAAFEVDLQPHFRWRWGEHGIYLAVCTVIGLLVMGLYYWPGRTQRRLDLSTVQLIPVHYVATADERLDRYDPFRDTRLIRPFTKQPAPRPARTAM